MRTSLRSVLLGAALALNAGAGVAQPVQGQQQMPAMQPMMGQPGAVGTMMQPMMNDPQMQRQMSEMMSSCRRMMSGMTMPALQQPRTQRR